MQNEIEKIQFNEYLKSVQNQCKSISCWPKFGKVHPLIWRGSGYCPFDINPGDIKEELGDYPLWAKTFKEKGLAPDGKSTACIQLDPVKYGSIVMVRNSRKQNDFLLDDEDIKLEDFLGEPDDQLFLERELINLGQGWPPVLIERMVAVPSSGDEPAIWSLCIVRKVLDFEYSEYETTYKYFPVVKTFGVEPSSPDDLGIEANWYREFYFNRDINDPDLLFSKDPIALSFELFGPLTQRNLISTFLGN